MAEGEAQAAVDTAFEMDEDISEQRRIRASMRERIKRGMVVLDRRYPGWLAVIDAETLDLGESAACIVGQVQAWQAWKDSLLMLDSDEPGRMYPSDLGMDLSDEDHDSSFSAHELYSWLTEAWVWAINARRRQQEAAP